MFYLIHTIVAINSNSLTYYTVYFLSVKPYCIGRDEYCSLEEPRGGNIRITFGGGGLDP